MTPVTDGRPDQSTSQYLEGTNYGLAIPSDATINGIVVTIGRMTSGTSSPRIRDSVVSLIKSGYDYRQQ